MFGTKVKAIYYKKRKQVVMTVRDSTVASLIVLVAGDHVKSRGKKVTIDVAKIKDVDKILSMIAFVKEIK